MKLEDVKKHWVESGKQFSMKDKVTPTSKDPYLGTLEEENIMRYLDKRHSVLEIGCGDASHTVKYAKRVKKLLCIDIAESLIAIAKKRVHSEKIKNVDFTIGSALDIEKIYQPGQFNCIISQRLLINLSKWCYQHDAICKVHSLLRRGGLFLLTEAFQEGRKDINAIRNKCGLTRLNAVRYNRLMVRKDFESFVSKYFNVIEIGYYGAYILFSRVFHPLVVFPREPKYDSKLNQAAMNIARLVQGSAYKKYSYQVFYALRKK